MQTTALYVQYNEASLWTMFVADENNPGSRPQVLWIKPECKQCSECCKTSWSVSAYLSSILKFIGSNHCQHRRGYVMNGSSRMARGERTEGRMNTAQPIVFQSVIRGEKDRNTFPVVKKGTGTAFRCVPVANHPWLWLTYNCCYMFNNKRIIFRSALHSENIHVALWDGLKEKLWYLWVRISLKKTDKRYTMFSAIYFFIDLVNLQPQIETLAHISHKTIDFRLICLTSDLIVSNVRKCSWFSYRVDESLVN